MNKRLPEWLRRNLLAGSTHPTSDTIQEFGLNTVCESCKCPNQSECWSFKTATFMILGEICTRACGFCNIQTGRPTQVEDDEPIRVAKAAKKLGLKHVVVTSVARDDLKDEGADQFYRTILAIQALMPESTIEVLTPDFHGRHELIEHVCNALPTVFNHNVETVERLTPSVRRQAKYRRSLDVLKHVKMYNPNIFTKSGMMVGLGETWDEIVQTMKDLRTVECDILTVGQYLKPREGKLEIEEFVSPQIFSKIEQEGKKLSFREVYSGPYVRSSYNAGETFHRAQNETMETVNHE